VREHTTGFWAHSSCQANSKGDYLESTSLPTVAREPGIVLRDSTSRAFVKGLPKSVNKNPAPTRQGSGPSGRLLGPPVLGHFAHH